MIVSKLIHLLASVCKVDFLANSAVPAPTVNCAGEELTAIFALSADPLLANQYLSVAGSDGNTLAGCNSTTANDSTTIRISIPFVGEGCNTTKTVRFLL